MFKSIIKFISNLFSTSYRSENLKNTTQLKLTKSITIKGGLFKDKEDERDLIKTCSSDVSKSIAAFSLREFAPRPIDFDQKSTSACGGFSASAFMYVMMNKMQSLSGSTVKVPYFSPLWIYWNARLNDGNNATQKDEGTTLRSVMKALKNPGVIEEIKWKFGWHTPTQEPNANAKAANKITLFDYLRIPIDSNAPDTVKEILYTEQLPIITGLVLYQEQQAEAYKTGYLRPVDTSSATCIGGHAICITGYHTDFSGRVWVEFINSWGDKWGDRGFGYFPIEWLSDRNYIIDIWTCSRKYF